MSLIAALQMVVGPSVKDNLAQASLLIHQAVDQGAKLVALPEMFAIAGVDFRAKLAIAETYGAGPIQDFLSHQAQRHQISIVAGTLPISSVNPNKVRAACLVYDAEGQCIARYDKIHLFDVVISETESYCESSTTEAGNQRIVIDTPVGKLGLAVCYDLRFPELFRLLSQQGAEIFILPAAFTVKTGLAHWEVLLRARAIENLCYLVAPAQCGTALNGRSTYGHSMIIDPWGEILSEAPCDQPAFISAEVDLAYLHHVRKKMPIFEHRKDLNTHEILNA